MKQLNPTIAGYIDDSNAHDLESVAARFAPDAVVRDEGQTHRGLAEIRAWIHHTHEAYQFKLSALDFMDENGEVVVTCEVSGAFPGSPVQLPFRFTLDGEKIAALTIG